MGGEEGDEFVEGGVAADGVGDDEAASHGVDACFDGCGLELGEEEGEWFHKGEGFGGVAAEGPG